MSLGSTSTGAWSAYGTGAVIVCIAKLNTYAVRSAGTNVIDNVLLTISFWVPGFRTSGGKPDPVITCAAAVTACSSR
jgi:hypothetical protein